MDGEDPILISGFSKLAIFESRLNAFNVVGGRKSIKMPYKPPFQQIRGEDTTGPLHSE